MRSGLPNYVFSNYLSNLISTNAVTSHFQILVVVISIILYFLTNFQGHSGGPMMSQASVEEDGVSWIEQGNLLRSIDKKHIRR